MVIKLEIAYIPARKEVNRVRSAVQPKYFEAKVRCSCGNEFVTGSTKPEIKVEICSKCHPFYTGTQKLINEAGGQVEKFNKRYAKAGK